jgi:hypothetical protein
MFVNYARVWPIHAILMGSAVLSLLTAVWTVTLGRRRKGSFRIHKAAAVTALVLLAAGFVVGAGMVQASGGPHFRVLHGVFGAVTIMMGVAGAAGGFVTTGVHSLRKRLRPIHVWAGRMSIVMFLMTIFLGLHQVGIL